MYRLISLQLSVSVKSQIHETVKGTKRKQQKVTTKTGNPGTQLASTGSTVSAGFQFLRQLAEFRHFRVHLDGHWDLCKSSEKMRWGGVILSRNHLTYRNGSVNLSKFVEFCKYKHGNLFNIVSLLQLIIIFKITMCKSTFKWVFFVETACFSQFPARPIGTLM